MELYVAIFGGVISLARIFVMNSFCIDICHEILISELIIVFNFNEIFNRRDED